MIDKNLQKQDFVNEVGLSFAIVAKMGKGKTILNKVLEKIAKYLECSIGDLIKYE